VSIAADGSGRRLESPPSTVNYWKPARVGRTKGLVAHGTASARSAQVATGRRVGGPDLGEGPFIAGGRPAHKRLPDREIELYAIRYFSVFAHPIRDVALLMTPGPSDVILSRLDGTGQRRIFQFDASGGAFSSASWSRDGAWIALTRGNPRSVDGNSDIWKMRADGSALQNLTPNSPGNDSFPSFSPDGRHLVFRSGRGGQFDLYVMNSDGGDVRQLTREPGDVMAPVFSPNGRQIAFLSTRDNPGVRLYEVYLADIDDRGQQTRLVRVTDNAVQEGHPAVSHDGQWIIFSSEQGGISDEEPLVQSVIFAPQMYGEMYAYRITNRALVRLTHNKWEEGVPSWERATSR
jgi:Tol biopolymer transport system component